MYAVLINYWPDKWELWPISAAGFLCSNRNLFYKNIISSLTVFGGLWTGRDLGWSSQPGRLCPARSRWVLRVGRVLPLTLAEDARSGSGARRGVCAGRDFSRTLSWSSRPMGMRNGPLQQNVKLIIRPSGCQNAFDHWAQRRVLHKLFYYL